MEEPERDQYNRIVPGTGVETWVELCRCRCADNTTKFFTSDNGSVYTPYYKITCSEKVDIKSGTDVRVVDVSGSEITKGEIYTVQRYNFFKVETLWV